MPDGFDPHHNQSFYEIPRTAQEAEAGGWGPVGGLRPDHTTLWAWRGDYRVGVLLDRRGSVAGVQVSVRSKPCLNTCLRYQGNFLVCR